MNKLSDLENKSIRVISNNIRGGKWLAEDVMQYFIETSRIAQDKTNCITQHLDEYALNLAKDLDKRIKEGIKYTEEDYPFLGIPISVKDVFDIKDFPTVAGLKICLNNIANEDSSIVKLVRDLGGIPFCKTNICQLGITTEGTNPVYGATLNPYNKKYSPGGSSSGEGPLLSLGGSILGLGSDIGGSLRYPACFNGVYCLKPTSGVFPTEGHYKFQEGQEYVKVTSGPMTRNMKDLSFVVRNMLTKDLQQYDANCIPYIPKKYNLNKKKLRFGYFSTYRNLPTTPAVERAVKIAVKALEEQGHQAIEFEPIEMDQVFIITSKIFGADSYTQPRSKVSDEGFDKAVRGLAFLGKLPWFIHLFVSTILTNFFGEIILSNTFNILSQVTVNRLWKLHAEANELYYKFTERYSNLDIDFLISPVFTHPSHLHGDFSKTIFGSSYSMLANLLNLPSGVIPVTKVNPEIDSFEFTSWMKEKFNGKFELGKLGLTTMYGHYDADDMKDIPVGVQIICKRYEDMKVIEAMEIVDKCVKSYVLKN